MQFSKSNKIVFPLAIVAALAIGFVAGSLDLISGSSESSSKLTEQPAATGYSAKLTEEQAIDVFVVELQEKFYGGHPGTFWQLYGCFYECIDDPHSGRQYYMGNSYYSEGDYERASGPVRVHKEKLRDGDLEGTYRHTWTAEHTVDGWWLISAKQLGYWILNEDKELTMTCEAFQIPELMNMIGEYIDKNAPAARSVCIEALGTTS